MIFKKEETPASQSGYQPTMTEQQSKLTRAILFFLLDPYFCVFRWQLLTS